MKFEHFENVYPNDEFDRLGSKEDAKLPPERRKALDDAVNAARAKVAELEKEIMFMAEDDAKYLGQSLEEKNLELKAAEADLADLLKEVNPDGSFSAKEDKPTKNKIDSKIFNN
ncbi:MAG: hypothetical protein HY931_02815 [Candidatus Falkowbacteria bacterium]|nr:MAG: hypothetical protein HY931_02815 [Candidatus Falkowbacteria bacterium]